MLLPIFSNTLDPIITPVIKIEKISPNGNSSAEGSESDSDDDDSVERERLSDPAAGGDAIWSEGTHSRTKMYLGVYIYIFIYLHVLELD